MNDAIMIIIMKNAQYKTTSWIVIYAVFWEYVLIIKIYF